MPQNTSIEAGEDQPVLRTPSGASPRVLRKDEFDIFSVTSKAAGFSPAVEAPAVPPVQTAPPAPLDWDFAMPAARAIEVTPPCAFLDPDANKRNQATGLRAPQEDLVTGQDREKFSSNWERLSTAPPMPAGVMRYRPALRPWYRQADGRLNFRAMFFPATLLLLGIVTFIAWRKVVQAATPGAQVQPAPAAAPRS